MFSHLTEKDLAGLYVLLAIATLPVLMPKIQKVEYMIKRKINKRLKRYGLRLKERN